ncbi:MAG: 50S ribosomal protein L17 [Sedimentisphaerales bacterium]|nr:50S ribosomal protein L17 [Sedimentisphaerales bacterium]
MRHRIAGRRLSRDSEHRLAMRRNMVSSLFEHGRVSTTIEKAKEVKGFAEKLITIAKKGDLTARRRVISLLGNKDIVDYEEGQPVSKGNVVGKLFSDIAPKYLDRPGGYTRIIKLAKRRLGDNGQVVLLQLIGDEEKASSDKKVNKRSKRAEAFAEFSKSASLKAQKPAAQEEAATPEAEEQQPEKTDDTTAKDEQEEEKQ